MNIKSKRFAELLAEELLYVGLTPTFHHAEEIEGENRTLLDKLRGVYAFDDLVVLKSATMPAVLIECGVIVNRKEELLVSSNEFHREFSRAVTQAISQFATLKIRPNPTAQKK